MPPGLAGSARAAPPACLCRGQALRALLPPPRCSPSTQPRSVPPSSPPARTRAGRARASAYTEKPLTAPPGQAHALGELRASPGGTPCGAVGGGGESAVEGEGELSPLEALQRGSWVKLICGASFEDVVDIRNLSLVYTLAGVDCIDCAADPAIVSAVVEGIEAALGLSQASQAPPLPAPGAVRRPWVMVSISDSEDPHFRKASFDPALCPPDCTRPCERVCPTAAIQMGPAPHQGAGEASPGLSGVRVERCYGCGRCVPACPFQLIRTESHQRRVEDVCALLRSPVVDAIEIHTLPGHLPAFRELWAQIGASTKCLHLVAVSTPDQGPNMADVMQAMYDIMRPELSCVNLWQLDGRPMSGDLGRAPARAAVRLAQRVLQFESRSPGFLQLAGGTNQHSLAAMAEAGLGSPCGEPSVGTPIAGVAYGGFARKLIDPILRRMESSSDGAGAGDRLEEHRALLHEAVHAALALVGPHKQP